MRKISVIINFGLDDAVVDAGPEAVAVVDVDDVLILDDPLAAEAVAVVAEFEPGLTLLVTRSPISPLGEEADVVSI